MKKLLKLEGDTISIKVTGWDFPEVFVYGDEFYTVPEFVGSTDKVTKILSGYILAVLQEMKREKKHFLRLSFDFCEEDYESLENEDGQEFQLNLFDD